MAPRRSSGRSGQLVLVMIRVSSTVDRFLQMGIVSIARVELTNSQMKKVFKGPYMTSNSFKKEVKQKLKVYLDFNYTSDLFDMGRFRKMQPLFEFCWVGISLVFCCELFPRARWKARQTRPPIGKVDDETRNYDQYNSDRISTRSLTTVVSASYLQRKSLPSNENGSEIVSEMPNASPR